MNLSSEMKKNIIITAFILLAVAGLLYFNLAFSLEWLGYMILIGIILSLLYLSKTINIKNVLTVISILFIITTSFVFYYVPSSHIARSQGTVLSPNWWTALNWIKNNTAECATIATYWDPGHFITSIAERPVVFVRGREN